MRKPRAYLSMLSIAAAKLERDRRHGLACFATPRRDLADLLQSAPQLACPASAQFPHDLRVHFVQYSLLKSG